MSLSPLLIPILGISIPIVAITGGVVSNIAGKWMAFKERQLVATSAEAAERAAQYAARSERLEQRVAVLERILTDRGTALADEIERLRDLPLN